MLVVCSHGSTLCNILFLLAHTTCTARCNKGKTYWHINTESAIHALGSLALKIVQLGYVRGQHLGTGGLVVVEIGQAI